MGRLPVLVGKDARRLLRLVRVVRLPQAGLRRRLRAGTGRDRARGRRRYRDSVPCRQQDEDLRVSVGVLRLSQFQLRRHERRGHALPQRRHHGARRGKTAACVPDVDYVAGVPDSGVPHAIGYSTECHAPFGPPVHQVHAHVAAFVHARRTRTCATAWRR